MAQIPYKDPLWRSNPIQYLIYCRFPLLAEFAPFNGLTVPGELRHEFQLQESEAERWRSELEQTDGDQIAKLIDEAVRGEPERQQTLAKAIERQRPYNQKECRSNPDFWVRATYWTWEEALLLSFGLDPKKIGIQNIMPFQHASEFAGNFADRYELINRARSANQLPERAPPIAYIAWFQHEDLDFDKDIIDLFNRKLQRLAELRGDSAASGELAKIEQTFDPQTAVLRAYFASLRAMGSHGSVADAPSNDQASSAKPELATRERDSLLKLVIGMAVGGYGYDPRAARSPIAAQIATDLQTQGLSLTDDTIRKYLHEAAELLPSPGAD
ncbi:hypothetical protein [Mangrovicella endophytica]|uniref:hypothetical protein n=1 Tax=Mangrovicella endophytica TaxID=2066697 RepID=UPI00130002EB|nr:hypothetical protein [Mangrovicella endophytica]